MYSLGVNIIFTKQVTRGLSRKEYESHFPCNNTLLKLNFALLNL